MEFVPTRLPDVIVIKPEVFEDTRGFFMETWHRRLFERAGIEATFVQDSVSGSSRGTIRGLHYQIRQAQGKLIRVVRGEAFDVAVDLRKSSPDFGQWASELLSADNRKQVWIPPGFAHGFLVLSDTAEFEYKCTDYYAPEHERTLQWDDPDIAIDWPLLDGEQPTVSPKDGAGLPLKEAEVYD
ncbi:MAG: dTDP-4-dehydrorhamnose 3,5-epimerase [Woeseia sp.]